MSKAEPLILIVEDDFEIADILRHYLERSNYRTLVASDGDTALLYAEQLRPDLLLLDLNLPLRSGFEVLSVMRMKRQTPVIVVSAMDDDIDKLSTLRMGADDYVTKPFNPNEVVARVAAVLRRGLREKPSTLQLGNLSFDRDACSFSTPGGVIDLTPSEFNLLSHLIENSGRAFSRGDLLDACLSESDAVDRTVDSHMSNLRRKLANANAGVTIRTIRGIGYRLDTGT
ncbi:response regulator transcription factor [Pseudaestuariivita rosea]|uniref:response regulator transcription factor n=1 Tax=Pseudaestuariivita rosea TaxID=2763263 RepID=UPI001ABA7825|nr:response regulator transcription factor [Pseudaestuariivita rosea]